MARVKKQQAAFVALLRKRSPEMDESRRAALAIVWGETSDQIIQEMLSIASREAGSVLHVDARPKVIFELARLMAFLNQKILDRKERERRLADHDPDVEHAFLASDEGRAMVSATARNLADGVWKPLIQRWRAYRPLILRPPAKHRPGRVETTSEPHRVRMHFVPQFSTKPWADAKTGKFDVHSLGVDREVRTRHGTAKVWGAVDYLYTQSLEARLGEIERDGREPFRKLSRTIPLTNLDRRFWVAFLVSQLVRTPREMTRIMSGAKAFLETGGINYPTDPAHLARAFETLFTANPVYAWFHDLVMTRTWRVLIAAPRFSFLKGDNPVVVSGSLNRGDWSLVYPLTPSKLFMVGPDRFDGEHALLPERRELNEAQTAAFNGLICGNAETSVISTHGAVGEMLRQLIKAKLGDARRSEAQPLPHWGLLIPQGS